MSIYDMRSGELRTTLNKLHGGQITAMDVSGCGRFVVTGGDDRRVVVMSSKIERED